MLSELENGVKMVVFKGFFDTKSKKKCKKIKFFGNFILPTSRSASQLSKKSTHAFRGIFNAYAYVQT